MTINLFTNEEVEPPGTTLAAFNCKNSTAAGFFRNEIPPSPQKAKLKSLSKPSIGFVLAKSDRTLEFVKKFYPDIADKQWNDWHWQIQNRITTVEALERLIHLSSNERSAISVHRQSLPVAITPYYASLLNENDSHQALRRTVVPVMAEYFSSPDESMDPLGEEKDSPVPCLVQHYPDRVLFLVTEFCSTYCRYCTRSRMVGKRRKTGFPSQHWDKAIAYIEETPQIRDVLLSGGDPLTLSNEKLEYLLKRLRQIPHVEMLRIGTKVPAVLPHRITPELTRMLKRYHPLWMSIHFTHPDELTPEVGEACERLADAGIPLGSQTVLLAGTNDRVDTMRRLVHGLLRIRVRPYYLYQCDPILGSAHFRTPVEKGLEIIRGLRGHTTGYALPTYVIDAPGGGGKIPLLPEYVVGRDGNDILLKNYAGHIYRYPDTAGDSYRMDPKNGTRYLHQGE
jgi:lysine 2,3-aminomutase